MIVPCSSRRVWVVLVVACSLMLVAQIAHSTDVSGFIFSDTTWTLAGSPYIVTGSVLVPEGVTLTIEPGVEVRFTADKALQVDGELIAQGTENARIAFTSHSGNSPGDWGYILFGATSTAALFDIGGNYQSGSIIQYATVEYGGGVSGYGLIRMDAASPFIDHCTIQHSLTHGVEVVNSGSPRISENIISNNTEFGVQLNQPGTVTITENHIEDNLDGGLHSYSGTSINVTYNVIRNNGGASSSVGGLDILVGSSTILGNIISGN